MAQIQVRVKESIVDSLGYALTEKEVDRQLSRVLINSYIRNGKDLLYRFNKDRKINIFSSVKYTIITLNIPEHVNERLEDMRNEIGKSKNDIASMVIDVEEGR